MKKIEKFLKKFEAPRTLYSVKKGHMSCASLDTVLRKNEIGMDAYFLPHGALNKENIDLLSHLYIDLDAGRDKDGCYYSDAYVNKWKDKVYEKVVSFQPHFDFAVETRNGFQLYWQFDPVKCTKANLNLWNIMQKRLYGEMKQYGADARVLKANQILRLPYTLWHKKEEGYQEFKTSVLEEPNDRPHTFTSLIEELKHYDIVQPVAKNKDSDQLNALQTAGIDMNPSRDELDLQVIEFLGDISQILASKNLKYYAKEAKMIARKIQNINNIDGGV